MKKLFTAKKNDADKRLDRFVMKVCPNMPSSHLYKLIRKKDIRVNGARAELSYRLCPGDTVSIFAPDEFFEDTTKNYDFLSASKALDIVYEDENIIVVDKPQGLIVHPDKSEYRDTLINRILRYLYEKGEYDPEAENTFTPALANRIDRNTCGMVLAAKNAEALKVLCDKIKLREIDKFYLCVVHGVPKKREALLTGYLFKDEDKNRVFLQSKKQDNNRTIKTKYRLLATSNNLSLLEVELLTGRTHQIRAHLSSIGHPLLGDGKYGNLKADKKMGYTKQALCSYKLCFNFKSDAGVLNYLSGKTLTLNDIWFARELFGENYKDLI